MRKSNIMTASLFCLIIICTSIYLIFKPKTTASSETTNESSIVQTPPINEPDSTEAQTEQTTPTTVSMDHALFIGDSRTVGLMEYSQINEADYFCNVGMSVFNIHDSTISVPNVGKVSLTALLDSQNYDKIYIMLGINEMGYSFNQILDKYAELIDFIQEKEPNADIFIQANLHVTSKRSNSDKTFNNDSINQLNTALSQLANQKGLFYLDANPLFDDENGNLSSEMSADNTHLYAKYYQTWGEWIVEQTSLLIKEE